MKKIVTLTILAAILSGCSNSDIYSGDVYTADQAKQVQQVSYGTVVSVRAVKIGGAILGDAIENKSSQADAVELEIKPENGSNFVIVQKGDVKQFYAGQNVKLITNGQRINAAPRYSGK